MRFRQQLGLFLQFLIDCREVVTHQRALVRHLAASENKRQQQRFAAIILDSNGFTILVDQTIIRALPRRLWLQYAPRLHRQMIRNSLC